MDNVYILMVVHSSTHSIPDTHIDSVYSSEKKAWEQIEVQYKTLIEALSKHSIGKIWFAEFRGKRLIVSYHTVYNETVYITYIIDKRSIK